MNRAADMVRKTQILKLTRDAASLVEAAGKLTDGDTRHAIGTLLYAAAALAVVDDMSEADFLDGCGTAWGAGQDARAFMKARGYGARHEAS